MERINQKETNAMIMYMLLSIVAYLIGLKVMGFFMVEVPKHISSRMMEGVAIVFLIIFVKFTPFKIYRTGFIATASEIKKTLIRCTLICLAIIVILAIARLIMAQFNEEISTRPWFYPYFDIHLRWFYPFATILQEFLSKGVMQENINRLLGEKNQMLSILACSILFIIFHAGCPLYYMICAGLLSMVTGYIYAKDKSIWGCAMVHFCVGFLPRAMGLK